MHSRLPALEKALFDYRERQEVSKRRSERCHTIDFRYRADTGFFDPTDEVYTGAGNAPTPTNAGTKTGGNETSSKEPGYGKNRAVGKGEQGLTFQGALYSLGKSTQGLFCPPIAVSVPHRRPDSLFDKTISLQLQQLISQSIPHGKKSINKGTNRSDRGDLPIPFSPLQATEGAKKDQTVCPQIGRAWQRLPSGRLASSDNSSDTDIADDRVPPVSGPSTVASGSIPPTPAIDQQPLPPPGFPVPLHSAPQGHLDLLPQMMAMMESVNSRMSQFEDTLRNLSAQQQQFQQAPVSLPFFPTPGALCGSCIRILSIPGAHH
ncbi:hypothetical protein Droror1_Dr00028118 [Drosera rotundifolia]